MKPRTCESKIMEVDDFCAERERLRAEGRALVFTNGCFDILHTGHVDYLAFARAQGDALVIGMNSDESIRRSKGEWRPIIPQVARARLLASLEVVDYVILFHEDEPEDLILRVLPDVLVKGEDWAHYVSGREVVEKNGGKVVLAPLTEGWSTTDVIDKIKAAMKAEG